MEGMLAEDAQKTIITSFVVAFDWDKELLADFFREEPKEEKVEKKEDDETKEESKQPEKPVEVVTIGAKSLYQEGEKYYNAQNFVKAVEYYRKAAEQGEMYAQKNLGWMYENGRGVAQSDMEAVKWYRKAAEQGEMYAQNNLGWMYQSGRGVAQDDVEAVKW